VTRSSKNPTCTLGSNCLDWEVGAISQQTFTATQRYLVYKVTGVLKLRRRFRAVVKTYPFCCGKNILFLSMLQLYVPFCGWYFCSNVPISRFLPRPLGHSIFNRRALKLFRLSAYINESLFLSLVFCVCLHLYLFTSSGLP